MPFAFCTLPFDTAVARLPTSTVRLLLSRHAAASSPDAPLSGFSSAATRLHRRRTPHCPASPPQTGTPTPPAHSCTVAGRPTVRLLLSRHAAASSPDAPLSGFSPASGDPHLSRQRLHRRRTPHRPGSPPPAGGPH